MNQKEYLIVGGGLAGLFFAHTLQKANKNFLVIDDANPHAASEIAAGMFGPLGGQLSKLAWKAPEMMAQLIETSLELESLLREKFIHQIPVEVAFGSVKDANDYACRNTNEVINQFLSDIHPGSGQLIAPYGCFDMLQSGWFNTGLFLKTYRKYLSQHQQYLQNTIDYQHLVQTNTGWVYQQTYYEKVVFAEGYQALNNPYIKAVLPFKLCKGQVLEIACDTLKEDRIIKKGIYLVPLSKHTFKAGATYEWDQLDELPTEQGKTDMLEKIGRLMDLPFKVLAHQAGIRPTTKDRNPIIGKIKHLSGAYVLNGLGTKGVVRGPWLAKTLFDSIENQVPIPKEVSIERLKTTTT